MASPHLHIGDRLIGPNCAPYIIAEMSANHLGQLDRALDIIDAAADAGVDAIKLQTYTADTITIRCNRPEFQITQGPWKGSSLYELYEKAHTPWEWHQQLFERGRDHGLAVFSSPFDRSAVQLLESLSTPAYKIASFELIDHDLIAAAAATQKPVILSSGMASTTDVLEAVKVAEDHGAGGVAVLHCISGYPTPTEQFNLRRIAALAQQTNTVVGISDHSPGIVVPVASVALGARIIEKHLTLRRSDGGPDASFSLEPAEFADLVVHVNAAWRALGDGSSARPASEAASQVYRRSLYAVCHIAKGEQFTRHNVRSIRPSLGLPPKELPSLLGKTARENIARGTPMAWDLVL